MTLRGANGSYMGRLLKDIMVLESIDIGLFATIILLLIFILYKMLKLSYLFPIVLR